jgi:hypothetical protein
MRFTENYTEVIYVTNNGTCSRFFVRWASAGPRRWEKSVTCVISSFILQGCIQKFPDWVDNEIYAYNTSWEATQRGMETKITRLIHKIAIQLHLVAESCTICSSRSRRQVRKLLVTASYVPALTPRLQLSEVALQFAENITFFAICRICMHVISKKAGWTPRVSGDVVCVCELGDRTEPCCYIPERRHFAFNRTPNFLFDKTR